MRGTSVIIAGGGLAGLTAARELMKRGAAVRVFEARTRIGGRVYTVSEPFVHQQHAELGADLIDESQTTLCELIRALGLRRTPILRGGFATIQVRNRRRMVAGRGGWEALAKSLSREVRALRLSELRWDGGIAEALAHDSVAQWLDRTGASRTLRDVATGMRGFFLADPEALSLLSLVDQFAADGTPGNEPLFRVLGGNGRIAEALAKPLGRRLELGAIVRRISQTQNGATVTVESHDRLHQIEADYVVCTLPTTTLRDVDFDPPMSDVQHHAMVSLRYGAVTKTALQFRRATWRRRASSRGFGTPLSIGAVWDGNEEQAGRARNRPGILTLMAGGSASRESREMLERGGPAHLVRELTWLPVSPADLTAWTSLSWERENWSRGGYAYFDPLYPPALRAWLARPMGRVMFAGEHTSVRWQGYMNGAVESGLRAADEIAAHRALRS